MSETGVSPGLFDRTLRRLGSLWRDAPDAGNDDTAAQMRACLDARGGEVSARDRAARLAQSYLQRDPAGRIDFLRLLGSFDCDPQAVADAFSAVTSATDPADWAGAMAALRRAAESPRLRLLSQFTAIPDGMKFLVDMRGLLITQIRGDKLLAAVDADLRGLLASWFDLGFLELRRIDWSSPACLLEKLMEYEAVHAIRSWSDLRNRLDSDRRCYAFFHPRMPNEPLIFVEVALVQGLADSVQALLDEAAPVLDPKQADTAIFYSISNCQAGLAGISFGNFLIKRVVALLSAEFLNLKQFATLSPIPGFRKWLDPLLAADDPTLLTAEEATSLREAVPEANGGAAALAEMLAAPGENRAADAILERLCARFLLAETLPHTPKRAPDAVAHFHLSNGARIERLNRDADTSKKGFRESAGLMVNYLYDPDRIEAHHEAYTGEGKRQASTSIRRLARGWG